MALKIIYLEQNVFFKKMCVRFSDHFMVFLCHLKGHLSDIDITFAATKVDIKKDPHNKQTICVYYI